MFDRNSSYKDLFNHFINSNSPMLLSEESEQNDLSIVTPQKPEQPQEEKDFSGPPTPKQAAFSDSVSMSPEQDTFHDASKKYLKELAEEGRRQYLEDLKEDFKKQCSALEDAETALIKTTDMSLLISLKEHQIQLIDRINATKSEIERLKNELGLNSQGSSGHGQKRKR